MLLGFAGTYAFVAFVDSTYVLSCTCMCGCTFDVAGMAPRAPKSFVGTTGTHALARECTYVWMDGWRDE